MSVLADAIQRHCTCLIWMTNLVTLWSLSCLVIQYNRMHHMPCPALQRSPTSNDSLAGGAAGRGKRGGRVMHTFAFTMVMSCLLLVLSWLAHAVASQHFSDVAIASSSRKLCDDALFVSMFRYSASGHCSSWACS